MPKGLFNWSFSDVEKFLKKNGFVYNYTNGSHYYFRASIDNKMRNVCVPFHANKSIKLKVIKSIILQSGIEMKKWIGK